MTDDVTAALEANDELTSLIRKVNHDGVNVALYMDKAERDRHILAAEVRRLHGMTCETCEHRRGGDTPEWEHRPDYCGKLSKPNGLPDPFTGDVFCHRLNYGCRAHTPRKV